MLAKIHTALTTVLAATDTTYQVKKNCIQDIVNRDELFLGQTPQTFTKKLLLRAHREFKGEATDDAMMIHAIGEPVHLVNGSRINFKITYKEDFDFAKTLI